MRKCALPARGRKSGRKYQAEFIRKVLPKTATQFNLHSPNHGIIRFRASTLNDKSQFLSKNIYVKGKKEEIPPIWARNIRLRASSWEKASPLIILVQFKDGLLAHESLWQILCLPLRLVTFRRSSRGISEGLDAAGRATSLVTCERNPTEMQAAQFQL